MVAIMATVFSIKTQADRQAKSVQRNKHRPLFWGCRGPWNIRPVACVDLRVLRHRLQFRVRSQIQREKSSTHRVDAHVGRADVLVTGAPAHRAVEIPPLIFHRPAHAARV